ncbi:MAG: alpha/beta fold hydrolase [Verrucomicrobiota bacterium]
MKSPLTLLSASCFLALSAAAVDPTGMWKGAIILPGNAELKIQIQLEESDQAWKGSIDIPAQGLSGFALSEISVEADRVRFAMAGIPGNPRFDGKLSEDGKTIAGDFEQGPQKLSFRLESTEEALTLNRPQTPKPPFPYQSKEVTFPNDNAKIALAGTFLIPEGEGPFPTVLFATGSGPQDRDETLVGHKPFLVIADYLARQGVASLRYDDRGFAESEGDHLNSTVDDFAEDAIAAIQFLTQQPQVNRDAIGIVGHSEGGLSGPKVAAQEDEVDFLVLLAPPGVPLKDLLARQHRDIMRAQGLGNDLIDLAISGLDEDLDLVIDASISQKELRKQLMARSKVRIKAMSAEQIEASGMSEELIAQNIRMTVTPWFRSLTREVPARHLENISIPVLALFGEMDIQVAAEPNSNAIQEALRKAANPDVEIKTLPQLNHLFQHSETGLMTEYGTIEETFAPEALEEIGAWIKVRFQK